MRGRNIERYDLHTVRFLRVQVVSPSPSLHRTHSCSVGQTTELELSSLLFAIAVSVLELKTIRKQFHTSLYVKL